MTTTSRRAGPITRGDIEAKFREVQGEVDDFAGEAVNYAVVAAVAAVVVVVVSAFLLGKRRGRTRSAIIEVRRV